ncbi:MAG: hypothetical protein ISS67_04290 [Desulfobacterales bacterium]|nr:hypothetical protein [Desulfobacterales bacterium]MBL7207726.1 hypothetical protein [Desulfobacterales bacterium]
MLKKLFRQFGLKFLLYSLIFLVALSFSITDSITERQRDEAGKYLIMTVTHNRLDPPEKRCMLQEQGLDLDKVVQPGGGPAAYGRCRGFA